MPRTCCKSFVLFVREKRRRKMFYHNHYTSWCCAKVFSSFETTHKSVEMKMLNWFRFTAQDMYVQSSSTMNHSCLSEFNFLVSFVAIIFLCKFMFHHNHFNLLSPPTHNVSLVKSKNSTSTHNQFECHTRQQSEKFYSNLGNLTRFNGGGGSAQKNVQTKFVCSFIRWWS